MTRSTQRPAAALGALAALALALSACSAAAAPSNGAGASAGEPSASPPAAPSESGPASAEPSASADDASPSALASPVASATGGTVGSAAEAVSLVLAKDKRFASLEAYDRSMIGQCCWYQVATTPNGWRVTVQLGWGDCPSGCIEHHRWVYSVSPAGVVKLTTQSGPAVPSGVPPGSY